MHARFAPALARTTAILSFAVIVCGTGASDTRSRGEPFLPPGDAPSPTAFSRLADAGDADDHEGFDHVIVHDVTINRVDERGVTSSNVYMLYKVLTEKGCTELSALRWGYEPQSSWVDVREVNLIRDGERIPVPVGEVRDLPAPQAWIYWSDRVKTLQLPRLRVGDGVEVRTYRKGFSYALLTQTGDATPGASGEPDDERFVPPMPGEYFDIVLFQADVPTSEKRYELHLPAAKRLHSRVYNAALYSSTTYDENENVYAWWGTNLPAGPHEPAQPDGSDYLAKVVVATVESWEAKSRWFFEVNDNQFASSPEIAAKVSQILKDAGVAGDDDDAKAEALLHWVAQNIRYSGQTMGKGEGFTLHPGTMIFEQRSGVCKDIAGMLVTMLRAAGIPANPAMTMAGSRIEDVPADQFNHCVVARRVDDGWKMYDPTWVPYNNDIWSKLETEQHYLIGSSDGETLSRIPYSPPEESPLRVRHEGRLDADGTLEGTIRFEGRGAMDSRLRRMVTRVPIRRLVARFAEILSPVSDAVEAIHVSHRAGDDFSGDMWIEVKYRAPGFALRVGDGLEFGSPAMAVLTGDHTLFRVGAETWPDERESDLFFYYTERIDAEDTIRMPRGYEAVHLPTADEVDRTYAYFRGNAEAQDGTLIIRSTAEVRRRQIPPEGYEGFTDAMRAARDWSEAPFRLQKEDRKEGGR